MDLTREDQAMTFFSVGSLKRASWMECVLARIFGTRRETVTGEGVHVAAYRYRGRMIITKVSKP